MRIRAGRGLFALLAMLTVLLVAAAVSPALAQDKSLIKEIQQRGELRVGYARSRPTRRSRTPPAAQWKGIAVELMEEWAKELDVKHVAVDTSWDDHDRGAAGRQVRRGGGAEPTAGPSARGDVLDAVHERHRGRSR